MSLKLGDLFKNGIKAATTWVGNTIGGPKGAAIGGKVGEFIGSALFDRKSMGSGRGDLDIIDTGVTIPQFGGRMQAFRPGSGRTNRGYAEVVNFATLNSAWDARLSKFYTDDYKVKKTLDRKKVV
tara:strand:+ start:82 stop:456 length:375 start_codon:yes stop_codon:yes gene_type:complete